MRRAKIIVQGLTFALLALRLHREVAPLFILFVPIALIAGNFYCGWVCPFGTLQEILGKIGARVVGKKWRLPRRTQGVAQYSRYLLAGILLVLLAFEVIPNPESVPFDAYQSFYGMFDAITPTRLAAICLALFLSLSLVVDRPFCNYFCVNAVEYALPSWFRFFTIKRDVRTCVNCAACDRQCPMNIPVAESAEVRNLQCINCFRCVDACPVPGALSYGRSD